MSLHNYIFLEGVRTNKNGQKIYYVKRPWTRTFKTKSPIKSLNRSGDLLYFTPEYLKKNGLVDNLGMIELIGLRKKYGRLKNVCLLELK